MCGPARLGLCRVQTSYLGRRYEEVSIRGLTFEAEDELPGQDSHTIGSCRAFKLISFMVVGS
jgi:hypothetical protein